MRDAESAEPGPFAALFALDPRVDYLNHGSFGACPLAVLEFQQRLRERVERQPVQFFARDLESLLDEARLDLARFLGADPEGLAWVPNATAGVNAVLRSLELRPNDELLTTDHAYNACRNALDYVAARAGARVVAAPVPFPVRGGDAVADAILSRTSPRTRFALIDHVTSPSGLVLPIEHLAHELSRRGIDVLVDGAHAPGMLPLDVRRIGAAFYVGNCHKWLCAPKGAGFLHVREDRRRAVRPACISHGANTTRTDRSRFLVEFDWIGTDDPTAVLSVPEALRVMGRLLAGGWDELRSRNHELALRGRNELLAALDLEPPCPEAMIGSLASVPIPAGALPATSPLYADPLQSVLLGRFGIEVPVIPWPRSGQRLVRISAQIYNRPEQYARLGQALRAVL